MNFDFSAIPEAPPKLINALKHNRAIAIVGSGLSVEAGYPTWKQLLLGMTNATKALDPSSTQNLDDVLAVIERGQLLDAANILKNILSDELDTVLKNQFDTKVCGPTLSHALLMQLPFKAYITTNYDNLLEQIISSNKRTNTPVFSNSDNNLPSRIRSGEPFILKLHGDFDHPKDIIFSRDDYSKIRNNNQLRSALKGLFQTSHAFWVGYGHNDPDLDLLIDEIRIEHDLGGGTALVKKDDHISLSRLQTANIFPSKITDYSQVPIYLNRLALDTDCHFKISVEITKPLSDSAELDSVASNIIEKMSNSGIKLDYVGCNGITNLYFSCSEAGLSAFCSLIDKNKINITDIFSDIKVKSVTLMDKKIMIDDLKSETEIEFTNRIEEIKEIKRIFAAPYILITAPYGYGKTRLLREIQNILVKESEYLCLELHVSRKVDYTIWQIFTLFMKILNASYKDKMKQKAPSELGEIFGTKINQKLSETNQEKVLLIFDEIESINDQVASILLNEFIPHTEEILKRVNKSISFRMICSGRYRSNWKILSEKISFTLLPLTPFDLEAVNNTVRIFNQQPGHNFDNDYIKDYSIVLWYFSGGHPKCMANILKNGDYGLNCNTIRDKKSEYYKDIIKPVLKDIESDIPKELKEIFRTISAVRRFNAKFLEFIISKNLIKWSLSEIDLEDQIRETYLVKDSQAFLTDDIFRRLLSMQFRNDDKNKYIKICEASISYYDSQLRQQDTFRLDIVAIELLFQKIQLDLCRDDSSENSTINFFKKVLTTIEPYREAKSILKNIRDNLKADWELKTYYSYLYPNGSFNNILQEILITIDILGSKK